MEHRNILLDIPIYDGLGLRTEWVDGYEISASVFDGVVSIKANKEGLETLARHMLTLAQDAVPSGHHLHYDDYGGLEENSVEIIIERI